MLACAPNQNRLLCNETGRVRRTESDRQRPMGRNQEFVMRQPRSGALQKIPRIIAPSIGFWAPNAGFGMRPAQPLERGSTNVPKCSLWTRAAGSAMGRMAWLPTGGSPAGSCNRMRPAGSSPDRNKSVPRDAASRPEARQKRSAHRGGAIRERNSPCTGG